MDVDEEEEEEEPHYIQLLHHIHETQVFELNVNCRHIYTYIPTRPLYQQLLQFPQVKE